MFNGLECFGTAGRHGTPVFSFDELGHPAPATGAADTVGVVNFNSKSHNFGGFDDGDL